METLLHDLSAHALKGRTIGLIQNGSWAPASGKLMTELIGGMKDMNILATVVTLRSTVSEENLAELTALADAIKENW